MQLSILVYRQLIDPLLCEVTAAHNLFHLFQPDHTVASRLLSRVSLARIIDGIETRSVGSYSLFFGFCLQRIEYPVFKLPIVSRKAIRFKKHPDALSTELHS